MKCPFCGDNDDKVVDSRESREGLTIRRRRQCQKCDRRFTSYEQIEDIPFMVIKNNGDRETFDRSKLLKGLHRACEKRPIPTKRLDGIVDEVERELHEREEREITTAEIGALVMEKLRRLDQVAYVRFASVYRRFEDVNAFAEELKNLQELLRRRG